MNDFIKLPLVLTIVCMISAISLSYAYDVTKPIIDENKLKKLGGAQHELFPEAESFIDINYQVSRDSYVKQVFKAISNGNAIGHVIVSEKNGYGGPVMIIFGLKDNQITKVKVLEQAETPGLGARIEEDAFLSQFTGKTTAEKFDTITGATISSSNVIEQIMESSKDVVEALE